MLYVHMYTVCTYVHYMYICTLCVHMYTVCTYVCTPCTYVFCVYICTLCVHMYAVCTYVRRVYICTLYVHMYTVCIVCTHAPFRLTGSNKRSCGEFGVRYNVADDDTMVSQVVPIWKHLDCNTSIIVDGPTIHGLGWRQCHYSTHRSIYL